MLGNGDWEDTRVRDGCVLWGSAERLMNMGQGALGDPGTRDRGTRSIPGCGLVPRMGTGGAG